MYFTINTSKAQLPNTFISDQSVLNPEDSSRIGFGINAVSYLRNTEYFNQIELGRTLFGCQFMPSLYLQPSSKFSLRIGGFVRSDFGAKKSFTSVVPTFTLFIKNRKSQVLFGTIDGALSHELAEPIKDINSFIERRIENGFQYKRTTRNFLDVWINWEKFIQRGDPWKEEFNAGIHYRPVLFERNNFMLRTPLQFTMYHRGGQIDTDSSNMIMVFNTAMGAEFIKKFKNYFLQEIKLDFMHLRYRENSSSGYFPFRNGRGNYLNLNVRMRVFDVMLSYWNGYDFIAPRGSSIYQSVSIDNPLYTERQRKLLFIRLLYEKEISSNLFLVLRYEPFLDLINHTQPMDYSYSVYLIYKDLYALGKLKKW